MNTTPLLTSSGWGTLLGFAVALIGLGIIDSRLAGIVGAGVLVVVVFKNAKGLGLE